MLSNSFAVHVKINFPFLSLLMESQSDLGWKSPLKTIYFQPPSHGQGHLPLNQVAQSSIPPKP